MREEIIDSAGIFTERDSLEASLGQRMSFYDRALKTAMIVFQRDTLIDISQIDPYMRHPWNKTFHYALADYYIEMENFDSAFSVLSGISNTFDFTASEALAHSSIENLYTKMEE